MAITLRRDPTRHWLIARADGALTIDAVVEFLRTARADRDDQEWPLLFDAGSASCAMTRDDVDTAVVLVRRAFEDHGLRAHVALIADDDALFAWMLLYETQCAAIGVTVIRAFRRRRDAEDWLEIMAAARRFQ